MCVNGTWSVDGVGSMAAVLGCEVRLAVWFVLRGCCVGVAWVVCRPLQTRIECRFEAYRSSQTCYTPINPLRNSRSPVQCRRNPHYHSSHTFPSTHRSLATRLSEDLPTSGQDHPSSTTTTASLLPVPTTHTHHAVNRKCAPPPLSSRTYAPASAPLPPPSSRPSRCTAGC